MKSNICFVNKQPCRYITFESAGRWDTNVWHACRGTLWCGDVRTCECVRGILHAHCVAVWDDYFISVIAHENSAIPRILNAI